MALERLRMRGVVGVEGVVAKPNSADADGVLSYLSTMGVTEANFHRYFSGDLGSNDDTGNTTGTRRFKAGLGHIVSETQSDLIIAGQSYADGGGTVHGSDKIKTVYIHHTGINDGGGATDDYIKIFISKAVGL